MEGKTPEIAVAHARKPLASVNTSNVIGLRDRAILAVLIYTAVGAGAAAKGTEGPQAKSWMNLIAVAPENKAFLEIPSDMSEPTAAIASGRRRFRRLAASFQS